MLSHGGLRNRRVRRTRHASGRTCQPVRRGPPSRASGCAILLVHGTGDGRALGHCRALPGTVSWPLYAASKLETMNVLGIDACGKHDWIGIRLAAGGFDNSLVEVSLKALIARAGECDVVEVDMRAADIQACAYSASDCGPLAQGGGPEDRYNDLGELPRRPQWTKTRTTKAEDDVVGPHRGRWGPTTSCSVRHWRRIRDSNS